MAPSRRKAAGIALTLLSLLLWTGLFVWVHEAFLVEAPALVLLVYFVLAGLGWVVPAMAIISWMRRG